MAARQDWRSGAHRRPIYICRYGVKAVSRDRLLGEDVLPSSLGAEAPPPPFICSREPEPAAAGRLGYYIEYRYIARREHGHETAGRPAAGGIPAAAARNVPH